MFPRLKQCVVGVSVKSFAEKKQKDVTSTANSEDALYHTYFSNFYKKNNNLL